MKSAFIWAGSISCFFVATFLGFLVYAVLVQKELIEAYVLFGVDLYKNAVVILIYCFGCMVVFGRVAVYASRKLPCSECGAPILVNDRYGFRGMACKPVLRVLQGRQICSNCLKQSA